MTESNEVEQIAGRIWCNFNWSVCLLSCLSTFLVPHIVLETTYSFLSYHSCRRGPLTLSLGNCPIILGQNMLKSAVYYGGLMNNHSKPITAVLEPQFCASCAISPKWFSTNYMSDSIQSFLDFYGVQWKL